MAASSQIGAVRSGTAEPDESTSLLTNKATNVKTAVSEVESVGSETSAPTNGKSNNPQILLLPFLLYCTAMGAVAVPKLNVIVGLMCVQYGDGVRQSQLGKDDVCNDVTIHQRVGRFMIFAHLISGVCCALNSRRIGRLSDRYGRKPLIAFTAIGLLFGDVMSVLASWFPHRISVYWVLLEFAVGGLSGTFSATMAVIQAFVVDCADESRRVTIFSRYHAAMFLGISIGPVIGEAFVRSIGQDDMLSVFYAAACCHAAFIAFVLIALNESVTKSGGPEAEITTIQDQDTTKPMEKAARWLFDNLNFSKVFDIFGSPGEMECRGTRTNLPYLAIIDGVVFGIQVGFPSALVLFAEYRFGWESMQANLFISLTNGVRATVLIALLPLVIHIIAKRTLPRPSTAGLAASREAPSMASPRLFISIIQLALLCAVASHVGFAVARDTLSVMLWGVPAAIGAVISPIAQSLMSSSVDKERIGELFGTVSLVHALARSIIPASMQWIYSLTVGRLSGAVFLVLSGLYGLALLLSVRLRA